MRTVLKAFLLLGATVLVSDASDELPTNEIPRPPEDAAGTQEDGSTQGEARLLLPNEYEKALAQMIISHPQQERREMVYDPHLHLVARAKVLDMARRKYKGHVDPDGFGPNHVVRSLGYELPRHYSAGKSANNIESFAWFGRSTRGNEDYVAEHPNDVVAKIVDWWYKSPGHKKHILGQGFNAEQTRFGIGCIQSETDSRRRSRGRSSVTTYAVLITAPPSLSEPPPLTEEVIGDYLSRTPAERKKEAKAASSR